MMTCSINMILINIYPMLRSSGKRAASSPLSSEFDKKSRLGLTDEEVNNLNNTVRDWMRGLPHYAQLETEDVSTNALALTFKEVACCVLGTARTSTFDRSWLIVGRGEERINLLPREVQLDLASIWVESRDKGEWERFANHRALSPSGRPLLHRPTQRHQLYFRLNLRLWRLAGQELMLVFVTTKRQVRLLTTKI
jgi:hypothetical protein